MPERQTHLSRENLGRDLSSDQPTGVALLVPILPKTEFALQVQSIPEEYSLGDRNQECVRAQNSGGNKTAHHFHPKHELHSYMPEPLDSRQLRAFASLARTGSFTQTARELRLS